MKKFVIDFEHNKALYSAKVRAKKSGCKTMFSITVLHEDALFIEEGVLLFLESQNGFKLVLFKKDRTYEELRWRIKVDFKDKSKLVDLENFCLS